MNKIEDFMDIAFGQGHGERTKLIMSCHYIFSRYKDTSRAKHEYEKNISFCNNENHPNLVLYDEAEDEKKTTLFYLVNSIEELNEKLNINKVFVENIKRNLIAEFLSPDFKSLLSSIYYNDAFNFEINFIINDYISDNQMKLVYEDLTSNTNISEYGDFNVYDKKKLFIRFMGEEEFDFKKESLEYGFKFYNPNNADTNLTNTFFQETKDEKILLCTIEGESLIKCHQKNSDKIFDRNIRYSISGDAASKSVDNSIKETIMEEAEKFLIYNNGITIVTEEMNELDIKNNIVYLKNFSIVNGAQTVSNLARFSKQKELFDKMSSVKVIAKIIQPKNGNFEKLVEKITKASNNQKPVKPRDFRSNSKEMITLKELFKESGYILDIKRGQGTLKDEKYIQEKFGKKNIEKIVNDELGQYILSLILMKPTVANQRKSKLFSDEFYNNIFKNENISEDYILKCYEFYSFTLKLIRKISDDLNFNTMEAAIPLKKGMENWLIALLWIIANNINSLEKLVNLEKLSLIKNEHAIVFNEKDIESFLGYNYANLEEFLHKCFTEISGIFANNRNEKNELFSPSAFSFKVSLFEQFVKKMLSSISFSRIEVKIKELKDIFK
ncbi:AIPR family protein [Spiroplasma endosymbiont of Cantharis rufa]|uniref:AIPR family protein n=1 Tax=Spiroplasma endosymbiont of Cantharis rufa TaxID=3066279 RepID=UPI0030D261DD